MTHHAPPLPVRRLATIVLVGCVLLLLLGAPALETMQTLEARLSGAASTVCAFRAQYGFDCLGCGGTRAFAQAAHGRFPAAFRFNRLGAMVGLTTWILALGGLCSLMTARLRYLGIAIGFALVALSVTMVVHGFLWWRALPPGFH
jgi:hypothetical protein